MVQPTESGGKFSGRALTAPDAMVFVIDDDSSVRDSIESLLKSVGLHAKGFASSEEFLAAKRLDVPSCLVLDVRLPGMNGLEFQDKLEQAGICIPIIFITAHGDIPMASRAIKAGAMEFLTKPFQKEDLLKAVRQGLAVAREGREEQAEIAILRSRFATLTPREREVLKLVMDGLLNKQIAAEMGLSEVTVKAHRGQAMQKMQADSLVDLVRMTEKLKRHPFDGPLPHRLVPNTKV